MHLHAEGFQQCYRTCHTTNPESIARAAVQLDLKKLVAKGNLPKDLMANQHLSGPLYLQVVSCKNIAAPSIRQENTTSAGRCLLIQVTDGVTKATLLEHEHVPSIFLNNLLPGTKLLIRNIALERGFMLLHPRYVVQFRCFLVGAGQIDDGH